MVCLGKISLSGITVSNNCSTEEEDVVIISFLVYRQFPQQCYIVLQGQDVLTLVLVESLANCLQCRHHWWQKPPLPSLTKAEV